MKLKSYRVSLEGQAGIMFQVPDSHLARSDAMTIKLTPVAAKPIFDRTKNSDALVASET